MVNQKIKLSVRSVSTASRARLDVLRAYTRLPLGALVDDAVEALWDAYIDEGHDLPIAPTTGQKQP